MATFSTPSSTERTHSGMVVHTSPISPVSAVGSKMNSPTDMAMPSTAARAGFSGW